MRIHYVREGQRVTRCGKAYNRLWHRPRLAGVTCGRCLRPPKRVKPAPPKSPDLAEAILHGLIEKWLIATDGNELEILAAIRSVLREHGIK